MFKNVLVGVDGRPSGRDAIALAWRLLDDAGKLTLAHVREGATKPTHALVPGLLDAERKASETLLARERAQAGAAAAELVSIVGAAPGRGLHEQAEDQRADLLVVGSCTRSALGRVMLGNDTRTALNGAPCAIAIACTGYREKPATLAKIGVAYNGTPESEAALNLARELAAPGGASILALDVVSLTGCGYTGLVAPAPLGDDIEVALEQASAHMHELDGVQGSARYGFVGEELASFSDGVDLLLVGSRGHGPVRRLVFGSTSDYLERHARCSLLVLPRLEHDARAGGAGSRPALRRHARAGLSP